jgi:hypothetical protein
MTAEGTVGAPTCFVRDYGFFLNLSIMLLPLLGSVAAGHRTIRFLLSLAASFSDIFLPIASRNKTLRE